MLDLFPFYLSLISLLDAQKWLCGLQEMCKEWKTAKLHIAISQFALKKSPKVSLIANGFAVCV